MQIISFSGHARWIATVLCWLHVSCTSEPDLAQSAIAQSPVVNSDLTVLQSPDLSRGTFPFSPWSISRLDNRIERLSFAASISGTSLATPAALTLSNEAFVLSACSWWVIGPSSNSYFFLVGSIDNDGYFSLWRFHDSNADQIPDEETKQLIFKHTTNPAYVTKMVQDIEGKRLYLLDRRCQDIWTATDTTGDGLPDTLAPQPFARSADHPPLLQAAALYVDGSGDVHVPLNGAELFTGDVGEIPNRFDELYKLVDSDGDLLADSGAESFTDTAVPAFKLRPYNAQIAMTVRGAEAQTIEVRASNLDGLNGTLLGSAVGVGAAYVPVTFARTLTVGEYILIKYAGDVESEQLVEVIGDQPQILPLSSPTIEHTGGTLNVEGMNLSATTAFRLYRDDNPLSESVTLTATIHSISSATVAVPPLDASKIGRWILQVYDLNLQDPEDALGVPVAVLPIH